jgi:hypothetical protein
MENTWKVLKRDVGEVWRRSIEPTVLETRNALQ